MTTAHRFPLGTLSEAVVAAQVMRLVERGRVRLEDRAVTHLPDNLPFVSNGASVRDLLGMRSGLLGLRRADRALDDPRRVWTPEEVLALIPSERLSPGELMEYSSINYLLLGLLVEEVTGRSLATVLRRDVLGGPGSEGFLVQPVEELTGPVALPVASDGATMDLAVLGGAVPSLNEVTRTGAGQALASDAASLARWWGRLCGGDIVSAQSLTEMTTFDPERWSWELDSFGLGLVDMSEADDTPAVGRAAEMPGYRAQAHCKVDQGVVAAAFVNRDVGLLDAGALAMSLSHIAATAPPVQPNQRR